jgi:hypothetical protein
MHLLFPLLGNILAVYLVVLRKVHVIFTMLFVNLLASILFGLSIAINVLCCSVDPSWWPMPLVIAPVEYWAKFGIHIGVLTVVLVVWSKKCLARVPEGFP